ncbi:MAG: DUF1800 family protein, partial [Terracidiphilus sp.]
MQRLPTLLGCALLLTPAALRLPGQSTISPTSHSDRNQRANAQALTDNQRILHALNRFTFGPRPDDLERVRAIGLDQWFELQLHPGTMDFTDLDRRLREYPAMRLPTQQLLTAFPSGAILRQTADGKLPVPNTPILRTIYNDQIAFMKEREEKKAEKKAEAAMPSQAPKDSSAAMMATPMDSVMSTEKGYGATDSLKSTMLMEAQPDVAVASGGMMAAG